LETLKFNQNVKRIEVGGNLIDNGCGEDLYHFIKENKKVQYLYMDSKISWTKSRFKNWGI
jgi:hypothetical protein